MTKILLEADFLSANIDSFFKNQVQSDTPKNADTKENPKSTGASAVGQKRPANFNWEKELQTRLADNKALSAEARRPEVKIEQEFWEEFFTNKWPADIAKMLDLVVGEQLKKDIRILGFTSKTNPIIAFLRLKYVQDKLIRTKLLNANTYKAIHNAVAKNLVADSEFFNATDYNIIYCQDLYTKSANVIEKYLRYQKQVLPTNVSKYTLDMQNDNKRVFLLIRKLNLSKASSAEKAQAIMQNDTVTKSSVKAANTKLNDLKIIEEILKLSGKISDTPDETEDDTDKKTEQASSDATLSKFANRLKNLAEAQAALQFIVMQTQNAEAAAGLKNEKFSSVSAASLAEATKSVAAQFRNIKLTKNNAKTLTAYILKHISRGVSK